jgi:hypothetical protein
VRKPTLASLVANAAPDLRLNEHLDHDDGALVFEHACRVGKASSRSGAIGRTVRAARGIGPKQEPERAGREERGGGGLGSVKTPEPQPGPGLLRLSPWDLGFWGGRADGIAVPLAGEINYHRPKYPRCSHPRFSGFAPRLQSRR